jgi:molybdenum cofactor cytidylyltransferase
VTSDIGIVLLAAGGASRFGSAKQAALIDSKPLLRRAAMATTQTGAVVTVVLGAHRSDSEPLLDGLDVSIAFNPQWHDGLGSSIALGVHQLTQQHRGLSAVMLCLADQALIDANDLKQLMDAHRLEPASIIAASFANVLGPPCLFPRADIDALLRLSGPQGARILLQRHAERVRPVPMPHAAIDIDTPDDLARLLR